MTVQRFAATSVWLTCLGAVGPMWFGGVGAAEEQAVVKPMAPFEFLEVKQQLTGDPILVVNYPWIRHQRPTIEIRRLDDTPETTAARPLYFGSEYMHGTNLAAMYRCEELSAGLPASTEFTKDEVRFIVTGRRNPLEKPSVVVRCQSEKPGPRYGVRAVYGLLEAWAVNNKTLFLELPREDFAQPGRIEAVFYRGEDVVWTERADWPGYPEKAGRGDKEKGRQGEKQ
ncbi:MAG: hypothetical protein HUU20_11875 [Pirellulales bacterium]|nr:hypothetical protein [Pirellulales bacterium]